MTATSGLNCRKGAGTGYEKVKAYPVGKVLKIYEKKGNWGKTDGGWICLKYTKKV